MKPLLRLLFVLVLALPSVSRATLVTIGSGQMAPNGPTYKLIWDSDNNGQSLVWRTTPAAFIAILTHSYWYVAGVNAALTYTLDPNYRLTWIDAAWRLPSPGAAPYWCQCARTSELGHLFYVELGLKAPLRNAENYNSLTVEELNAGEFDNLIPGVMYSRIRISTATSGTSTWARESCGRSRIGRTQGSMVASPFAPARSRWSRRCRSHQRSC